MSTTPPATTDPTPASAPVETAPSATVAEGPALARVIGFIGLFLLVLGGVVIVTTRAVGPRWVSEGYGFVFAALGLALMLYHAATDSEQEVRRLYGVLAAGFLVLAVASALLPGPFDGPGTKQTGYYLSPWGLGAGFLALMFAVPFTRHETDEMFRNIALYVLLGIGGALCIGVVAAGLRNPDYLAGTGLVLAVLGVSYICAYLSQVDTADGPGYTVAFVLGAVGAVTLFYAFGRTVFPTVLYEGPNVGLRKANQSLDSWKVVGRGVVILTFLGMAALGALGKFPDVAAGALGAVGLIGAGVFVAATFGTQVTTAPKPFLVPGGLLLGAIGTIYLAVAVGVCSDSQFVTLTRRELAAYFFSPIGYLVISGMAMAEGLAYREFVNRLAAIATAGRGAMPEPIVQIYFVSLWPVLALTILVPMLTMRSLSEERRTGSIEVLFTAPVSEWVVVMSKFLATWFMFMLCWMPMGLFLIVLRIEGGTPFDYRPLLGFYIALAITGAAFVAMGLFVSALTTNQIIAAVLTFVPMILFLVCYFVGERNNDLGQSLQLVMKKMSYLDLWTESLSGQLPVRDLLLWASLTVFWLFLSIKVLEARRWS